MREPLRPHEVCSGAWHPVVTEVTESGEGKKRKKQSEWEQEITEWILHAEKTEWNRKLVFEWTRPKDKGLLSLLCWCLILSISPSLLPSLSPSLSPSPSRPLTAFTMCQSCYGVSGDTRMHVFSFVLRCSLKTRMGGWIAVFISLILDPWSLIMFLKRVTG